MQLEITGKIKDTGVKQDKNRLIVTTKLGGEWIPGMYAEFNPEFENMLTNSTCWRGINANQPGTYTVKFYNTENNEVIGELRSVEVKNINATKTADKISTSLKLSYDFTDLQYELEQAITGVVKVQIKAEMQLFDTTQNNPNNSSNTNIEETLDLDEE